MGTWHLIKGEVTATTWSFSHLVKSLLYTIMQDLPNLPNLWTCKAIPMKDTHGFGMSNKTNINAGNKIVQLPVLLYNDNAIHTPVFVPYFVELNDLYLEWYRLLMAGLSNNNNKNGLLHWRGSVPQTARMPLNKSWWEGNNGTQPSTEKRPQRLTSLAFKSCAKLRTSWADSSIQHWESPAKAWWSARSLQERWRLPR